MINFRKREKRPFEWNQVNKYLQWQSGKKHYWGIRGKDYGLMESPTQHSSFNQAPSNSINQLKSQHLAYVPYQPRSNSKSPERQYNQQDRHYQKRQKESFDQIIDQQQLKNQYKSLQPSYRNHVQIKQALLPPQPHVRFKTEIKRPNLSLQSKSIHLSNQPSPMRNREGIKSLHHQFSVEIMPQMHRNSTLVPHQRIITDPNQEQIDKYRERIVRIVKKDRKNNPTFCNSPLYPLYCHRYVA